MCLLDDTLPDISLGDRRRTRKKRIVDPDGVPCVSYTIPRCPRCNSKHVPVYDSGSGPMKYRHCRDCGKKFKSFITNYEE